MVRMTKVNKRKTELRMNEGKEVIEHCFFETHEHTRNKVAIMIYLVRPKVPCFLELRSVLVANTSK